MGKGSAPQAPDPVKTARAQTASNRETAITQSGLNMVNQTTPFGSLSYEQTGKWADGTPRFSATQTLSPEQQQLYQTGVGTQQNLANLAQEQSGRLGGLLNEPLDWSAQQTFLNDLTTQQLDPVWERQQEQQQTDLLNRGVMPGSTAYQRAMDDFQRSRSSSYNDALLNNYGTALQSQMALRQQPLNELIGLASGTQIQSPQFMSTPATPVGGTDVAGLYQNQYQGQLANYQMQQQQQQGLLGGLFGLGSSALMAFSDVRLKENAVKIGETQGGVGIYEYNFKGAPEKHVGVMAQELQKKQPEAVSRDIDSGYLMVDYSRVK